MGCYRNQRNQTKFTKVSDPQYRTVDQQTTFTAKKPDLTINYEQDILKHFSVLFFVDDYRGCGDPNRFVDDVIRWLIEDDIKYEKHHFRSPIGRKHNISKTPVIGVVFKKTFKPFVWQGIVLSYRKIFEFINGWEING